MIIRKLIKLYYFLRYSLRYDLNFYLEKQIKLYKKNNLDRDVGLNIFQNLKSEFKALETEMHSEHQIIFSALSKSKEYKFHNILEIGTFDGTNTLLLSRLFPDAKIFTLDLPTNSDDFKGIYNRKNSSVLNKLINTRDKILKSSTNINFFEKNSLELINEKKNFDLIWIDGAHGYPIVPIDIANAVRLCNKNGIIMCDDVFLEKIREPDEIYFSNASIETIRALKKVFNIEYDLFYKRLDKKFNSVPYSRQYIAYIKKNN